MNSPQEKVDHAYQNAQGWAESIASMVAALECDYGRLQELRDAQAEAVEYKVPMDQDEAEELFELTDYATIDGDLQSDADSVRERIQESPLSVEVRSGWTTPGSEMEAEEFMILLSTGGPALRIRGELGKYAHPERAWLEYQDWGTPWTEYHGEGCEHSTLLTFCQQFYFGE